MLIVIYVLMQQILWWCIGTMSDKFMMVHQYNVCYIQYDVPSVQCLLWHILHIISPDNDVCNSSQHIKSVCNTLKMMFNLLEHVQGYSENIYLLESFCIISWPFNDLLVFYFSIQQINRNLGTTQTHVCIQIWVLHLHPWFVIVKTSRRIQFCIYIPGHFQSILIITNHHW